MVSQWRYRATVGDFKVTGIEAIFGVLGSVISAAGAAQQGQAAKAAADYNAKLYQQEATTEREAAAANASDYRRTEHQKQASSIAAQGASGVTMAGSPLMVDEATVKSIALGAARMGWQGQVRATHLQNEADLEKMRGRSALQAGYLGAGTSLLSGFGSAFSGFYGT